MEKQYKRDSGEAQIAVLIDYENVGLASIQYLFDQVSDVGRIIVKRAYADWTAEKGKRDQLLELGIEAIHLFKSTSSGKNASDIRLAIDAVDLLFTSPIDTFAIVSSDSDFVPLVMKLRSAGKSVIGAGRSAVASRTLITACDRYIFLDMPERPAPIKEQDSSRQTGTLLLRAMNASMDSQGQALGAKLHQTMIRLDPSFNFRALGYKTFTQFLSSSKGVRVSRPSDQSDFTVELIHAAPGIEPSANGGERPPDWDRRIDEAWAQRPGEFLPGPWASSEAAKVLGVPKLSASTYKTLQGLLDASEYLASRWQRRRNAMVRKQ